MSAVGVIQRWAGDELALKLPDSFESDLLYNKRGLPHESKTAFP